MAEEQSDFDYKCPICLEILEKPVTISCGHNHVYCQACVEPYKEQPDPACPECRERFDPHHLQKRQDLTQKINTLNAECKWCYKPMKLKELRQHLTECDKVDRSIPEFRPVKETSQQVPRDTPNRSTFRCPYCRMDNLDLEGLKKHCNEQHETNDTSVVCPVCAAMPWGERNQKSANFIAHLNMRHRFEYETYVDYEQDDEAMLQAALQASMQDM